MFKNMIHRTHAAQSLGRSSRCCGCIFFSPDRRSLKNNPSTDNRHRRRQWTPPRTGDVTCTCVRTCACVCVRGPWRGPRGVGPTGQSATRGPTANHSSAASFVCFGSDCALVRRRYRRTITIIVMSFGSRPHRRFLANLAPVETRVKKKKTENVFFQDEAL